MRLQALNIDIVQSKLSLGSNLKFHNRGRKLSDFTKYQGVWHLMFANLRTRARCCILSLSYYCIK